MSYFKILLQFSDGFLVGVVLSLQLLDVGQRVVQPQFHGIEFSLETKLFFFELLLLLCRACGTSETNIFLGFVFSLTVNLEAFRRPRISDTRTSLYELTYFTYC